MDDDRVRGVLWGQAVGDALGTTVEFLSPQKISARRKPDGWPREIVGAGPFRMAPGQVTDDTELALALARTLAEHGTYDDDAVAAAYVAWCRSGPKDCGMATGRAFNAPELPPTGAGNFIRRRADPDTQANGSLMRVSPLGLFGRSFPSLELARLAARDSTLSHPHPVCQAACAVYAVTIAEAITTDATGPELYDFARNFAAEHLLTRPIVDTLQAAADRAPSDSTISAGWVRLAFQHAFYQLRQGKPFEEALVEVIRHGGDTDTNACITGALLGAALGESQIPARWRAVVQACRPERPPHYHCHDLSALAMTLARRDRVG
jgi:ADP-ribosyl-[dinitrogen reductase] hydrolase